MAKDQTQAQGMGKSWQSDEALAADTTSEGGSSRRRKGKCHHCGKDSHWVCECRTKKREEAAAAAAAAAANRSGQPAQANTSTSTKPENRPVGYANVAFEDESDDGGFWAAAVDVACAYPDYTEPDPLMGEPEDDDVDEWEAFRAETWGAEDDEGSDRAGFGIQLVKEGEETDVEEEAGAATLLEVSPNPLPPLPTMRCTRSPLATTWCHVGHWMKRGTHPRSEKDAPGPPPCAEGRSRTPCTTHTTSTMSCAHRSSHISMTPSQPSARARVSRPWASRGVLNQFG